MEKKYAQIIKLKLRRLEQNTTIMRKMKRQEKRYGVYKKTRTREQYQDY